MKCPNCQKTFRKGNKCPHCDVDAVLYMGTVRISEKLYNQGLERLKASDFFHGIKFLTKSIAINKNHVPSRNLLGLALFEVGHIGEALKHWAISQSMLLIDNNAAKYIESANKNVRQLEKLNDSVTMYNHALAHIKQSSDDLAIIQLKKAVEINPRFVDALNLLTLCYLIQNDTERASAMAERVLKMDACNPIAQNYYAIINPGKTRSSRQSAKQKTMSHTGPYKPMGYEEKKRRSFHFAELCTFLIGVAVTFAACYFLLVPGIRNSHNSDFQEAQQNWIDERDEYRERITRIEGEIDEREQRIATLRANIDAQAAETNRQWRITEVNRAYSLLQDGEFREALNILDEMGRDTADLPPDIVTRLNFIISEAYPVIGLEYYNQGLAAFNPPRDVHRAIVTLEEARYFLDEDVTQWNRMLFMLGVLYFEYPEEARRREALEVLSELRERAPNLPHPFTGGERQRFNEMMSDLEDIQT